MFLGCKGGTRSGEKKQKVESKGPGEIGSRAPEEALGRRESSFSFAKAGR